MQDARRMSAFEGKADVVLRARACARRNPVIPACQHAAGTLAGHRPGVGFSTR
jgi:hypothetical protein